MATQTKQKPTAVPKPAPAGAPKPRQGWPPPGKPLGKPMTKASVVDGSAERDDPQAGGPPTVADTIPGGPTMSPGAFSWLAGKGPNNDPRLHHKPHTERARRKGPA